MQKPRLQIEHLDGSTLTGLEQEFSGPVVRLGTSPASHVCYDPDEDTGVAETHAEIRLESDGLVIADTSGGAGVAVNGEAVSGTAKAGEGDVVRLGADGPEVRIAGWTPGQPGAHPGTVVGGVSPGRPGAPTTKAGSGLAAGAASTPPAAGVPSGSPSGGPAPTVVGTRRGPQDQQAPGGLPPVRVGLGGGGGSPAGPGAMPPESAPLPKYQSPPKHKGGFDPARLGKSPGSTVGMNTLMGVVQAATSRERKRTLVILGACSLMLVFLVMLVGVAAMLRPTGDNTDWQAIMAKIEPSVCVAMKRPKGGVGEEEPFGTVWSVDPEKGIFATNCHVAALFFETIDGQQVEIIIRTPGNEPKDLLVKEVVMHPDYEAWTRLGAEYNYWNPGGKWYHAANTFAVHDVALMIVAEADREHQPPGLPLASERVMEDLRKGAAAGSLGYPMESKVVSTRLPQPESAVHDTAIAKTADVWLDPAEPIDADHFWYQFEITGGASGSPVFDDKGRVIGLLAAGDMKFTASGRVPVGGKSIGPNVSILKELLDGTADERHAERVREWEARFREAFANTFEHAAAFTKHHATVMFSHNQLGVGEDGQAFKMDQSFEQSAKLTVRGGRGTVSFRGVTFHPGGNAVCAIASDPRVKLWVRWSGRERPPLESLSYSDRGSAAGITARGEYAFDVVAEQGTPDGTYDVVLYAYHKVPL